MATPILPGNPAGIGSTTTAGTPAPSAQQVPAGPSDKQSLSVAPPDITLAQALPVVLDALAGIPAMRWPGVQAMLAQAVGHPEMRDDLAAELRALLQPRPGKQRIPPDMPAPARLTVSAVVLRLVPRVAT